MKNMSFSFFIAVITLSSAYIFNTCAYDQNNFESKNEVSHVVTINYEFGTDLSPTGNANIYAIWIENAEANFIQNIKICKSLMTNYLTGTAIPYWKINKYPISSRSEIDAVTSATQKNCDFSVSATLKDPSIRKFKVCCEIDRSFEPNDWFTDQPAVVYCADINMDETATTYELKPIGWTPNENTENIIPNTPKGVLQNEMKYITNLKNDGAFGGIDPRSLTSIVKRITVTIQNGPSARVTGASAKDIGVYLDFNQNHRQISVVNQENIDEIVITDSQGKMIFKSRPQSKNALVELDKNTINGLYLIKIITRKGISFHKILIKG